MKEAQAKMKEMSDDKEKMRERERNRQAISTPGRPKEKTPKSTRKGFGL